MRASDFDDVILALVVILAAIAMSFSSCEVEAQPSSRATPEEILAALTVNESDWDSPGDMWGIYAVLANIGEARGVSWLRAAHMHSPHFFAGTGPRPWAAALRDSDAPPRLSMGAGWINDRVGGLPSRRSRFHDLVALAYEVIRSQPVCSATTWGNARDYSSGRFAAEHAHDVFVDCSGDAGPTRNLFSHAPGEP